MGQHHYPTETRWSQAHGGKSSLLTRCWRACLHSLCTQQLCIDYKHSIRILSFVSPPNAQDPPPSLLVVLRRVRESLEEKSGVLWELGSRDVWNTGPGSGLEFTRALPHSSVSSLSLILWVGQRLGHFEIRRQQPESLPKP